MTEAAPDPRDRIIQKHAPAVMVPRHGTLDTPTKSGHRFLVASDGLWMEVKRPWLHARVAVGYSEIQLPYGDVGELLQYAFSEADIRAIEYRFLQDAARAFPNECAAWAVYDDTTGRLDYRPLIADEASPASVKYHTPRLADHEHLAIDIHSHGALGAGFSGTDDDDDAGDVKYAIVVGNLDAEITYARRLCLNGYFLPLDDREEMA